MTAIENISWPELLKNPIVTAQCGNDGNRIATATETLRQTTQQSAQLLNEHARLLANGSGLGYLCTGDVYCQQGHYAAAISIYDQGLQAVLKSDPYYQQLQQQRIAAIANNNQRVDFIIRLPLDIIISHILPKVQSELYCDISSEYLYVSHAWQEQFLQQPDGLYYDLGSKKGHPQLVRFAPYIQSLRVSRKKVFLDDLFSRAHFSNLMVLDILDPYSTPHGPIKSGLKMVAASLTHLYIKNGYMFQLRDILEPCPNIVSLTTEEVEIDMPLSTRYPKMKHLSIHTTSKRRGFDEDTVVDLLSRFPSLLSFAITPVPDSSILTILHEHCPYLQRLDFGGRRFRSTTGISDDRSNRKGGITMARLNGFIIYYRQHHVIQFLLDNQSSLETFECDGKIYKHKDAFLELSEDGRLGERGPTQSFTRLTNLCFAGGCSLSWGPFIAWIVKNAPNLKAIRLTERVLQPAIADVLIKSKHLSRIEITRLWEDRNIFSGDFEGIFRFFQYHTSMEAQSTLQEIILHAGMSLPFELECIHLIPKLKCLKNLELLADNISVDCIPLLEAIGDGCTDLERLTLGKKDATFDGGLMEPLSDFPNLKCLRIRARYLSNDDFDAFTTFPSLELLYLQCDVPDFIMERLLKHISKVIIE